MSKKFGFAFWQSQRECLEDYYYNQGLSSNEIGKIYGCYGETITANMNRLGFKLRQVGSAERPNAIHKLDTSFFNDLNNETTAYVLGYTITDGHVTNDGKIMYCATDKDIIYKIHEALKSTHPINLKMQNGVENYLFNVSSKYMCKKLWDLGIDNNKSFSMKMDIIENKIQEQYMRDLIRGMIDGDGSIGCTMNLAGPNKKHTFSISFTNNYNLCSFISRKLGITNKWYDEGNGFYTIRTCNRKQVIDIGHYLYDDATIYMDRKKNKFDEICQTYEEEK